MENPVEVREELVEPLLSWYSIHARELPWRIEKNPYEIWISEVMLQQTRVEAVKPYYERFLKALPNVTQLAAAPEDMLLKLWEGLGYYNRVRNLQKAAILMVEQYNGTMPKNYEELLTLPGIGTYTAGAIASIAYGECVPAIDGNVLRIIARVEADYSDIASPRVKKELEVAMKPVIPAGRAGDFNQALMELGATVCLPNGVPNCPQCPWKRLCQSYARNLTTTLPIKATKKKRVIEEKTILVIQDQSRVLLRKRGSKGLLAGMYEFPSLEGYVDQTHILAYMKELGYPAIRLKELEDSKHIFSHREWHMKGYLILVDELLIPGNDHQTDSGLQLIETIETERHYPIPAAFTKYAAYLNIKLGQDKYRDDTSI